MAEPPRIVDEVKQETQTTTTTTSNCAGGICNRVRQQTTDTKSDVIQEGVGADLNCCSTSYCRGMMIAALVMMVLIFILTVVWFSLDFANVITQADDAWFAMGTFILAFIGIILMLVTEAKCNRCFVCS